MPFVTYKTKKGDDKTFQSRVFFIVMNVFILYIFLSFKNDLSLSFSNGNNAYWITFSSLGILTIYLFFYAGKNPGYPLEYTKKLKKQPYSNVHLINLSFQALEVDE